MWKLTPKEQKLLLLIGLMIVSGIGLRFVLPEPAQKADSASQEKPAEAHEAEEKSPSVELISNQESSGEDKIIVHVAGGVNQPGVYNLPEGSRAFEAIEKAGGALQEELLQNINLAQPLYDGQQLIVPTEDGSEANQSTSSQATESSSLLNINRATMEELERLPGIGPVKAGDIVRYREDNGPFRDIQDLTQVSGIGAKTLETIEENITIY